MGDDLITFPYIHIASVKDRILFQNQVADCTLCYN